MTRTSARSKHKHTWEPATVPCATCVPHPAVRCTDPDCPLHGHPVDISKYGDPRKIEAELASMRAQLEARAEAARVAYRQWQDSSAVQDKLGLDIRTLEEHYRQVASVHE